MKLGKIYLVMNGGGEYESQWDEPLRAFRSKEKATQYMEQLKAEHELDKKFCTIARKAAASVSRMRGGADLYRWTSDANNAIKEALQLENVPANKLDHYMKVWQTYTDLLFWMDEIEYDTTK
jgi:hypothetical protein